MNISLQSVTLFLYLLSVMHGSTAGAAPARIVSINLCTDQLLLMLAQPDQIASISHLALEPHSSYMASQAAGFYVNHINTEELLMLQPDLILASSFSDRSVVSLLQRLGYQVALFKTPESLEDIRTNIGRMGKLVGNSPKAELLIQEMDRRIETVQAKKRGPRPKALFYQPRGYTSGRGTLQDLALKLAGWRNLSAELGIIGYGSIDLERVILAEPDRIFTSSYAPGTRSLAQHRLQHPALLRITDGERPQEIAYKYWICGGPMIAEAIEQLDAAH